MEIKKEIIEQILINQSTILASLDSMRFGIQNKWLITERMKETSKLLDKLEGVKE